ncbi:MAG: hypothetical protein AAB427_11225 [Chloroflexota bacterium]
MLALRGIYDGKTFRVLTSEKLPNIKGVVPVAIIFLEDMTDEQRRLRQIEAARWMREVRAHMPPLDMSIKDMIEEGRER